MEHQSCCHGGPGFIDQAHGVKNGCMKRLTLSRVLLGEAFSSSLDTPPYPHSTHPSFLTPFPSIYYIFLFCIFCIFCIIFIYYTNSMCLSCIVLYTYLYALFTSIFFQPIMTGAKVKGVNCFCINENPIRTNPFSVEVRLNRMYLIALLTILFATCTLAS